MIETAQSCWVFAASLLLMIALILRHDIKKDQHESSIR